MGNGNPFFQWGGNNPAVAEGASKVLGMSNAFLGTGYRSDNVWSGGGTVGATGASGFMDAAGQMAGQFGPYGQMAQGALSMGGAMTDLFSYDPDVGAINTRYSSDELPSFDLSDEAASTANFMQDFNRSANKKIGKSILGGATTGAALGTVVPGIGTAIGAVGGAITGFVGGLLGKSDAKGEAQDAATEMQQQYGEAVGRFNASTAGYYGRENAMERYRANQQSQANLFNVPKANPYFYLG